MDMLRPGALAEFEAQAAKTANILKLLANQRRLLILCRLIESGEMAVSPLAEAVGLSQSALSQHLARMREEGLVAARREAQTIHYRVSDPKVARIIALLAGLYCPTLKGDQPG